MTQCRLTDPDAGAADSRMGAYLEGQHRPRQALPSRVAYVAVADDVVVAGAEPFYSIHGASTLNEHWCVWEYVEVLLTPVSPQAPSGG